jgi:hypothetical protein
VNHHPAPCALFVCFVFLLYACEGGLSSPGPEVAGVPEPVADSVAPKPPVLDTALYDRLMSEMACHDTTGRWPATTDRPLPGALLPFNRIVAFYGNLYVKGMGILGELEPDDMLKKLGEEAAAWAATDTLTPVVPALHYIAVTAQPRPGTGSKYRQRMPGAQIDKVLDMAKIIDAIVFLDVQVGHSTLQEELPELEAYLQLPKVHLGIDPEFSMKDGRRPGSRVGHYEAADINYAIDYLSGLVKKHQLPPKILVVHRFNKGMVKGYADIKPTPEVQVVMHMDGFGFPAKKINSYQVAVVTEPVQFAGFKIFYKNDARLSPGGRYMSPGQVLELCPKPVYIQYQ